MIEILHNPMEIEKRQRNHILEGYEMHHYFSNFLYPLKGAHHIPWHVSCVTSG